MNVKRYEYLSHTADVQLHGWGDTLCDAINSICVALYDYMSNIDLIDKNKNTYHTYTFHMSAHDCDSLIYNVMDECLFQFATTQLLCNQVHAHNLQRPQNQMLNDNHNTDNNWSVDISLSGETFDIERHEQGTEIKAITYSNMQVHETDKRCDIYVIVDI